MSYILDALKRADAERERGRVPGLHSQAVTGTPAGSPGAARPVRLGLTLLLLVLLLAGSGVWWWTRPGDAAPPPTPLPAPSAAPTAGTPPGPPADTPVTTPSAPPPPAAAAVPTAVAQPTEGPPLLAPAPAPEPTRAAPAASPVPPGTPASGAQPTVRRLAELSAEQRAQLPRLAVSGASYSTNPAHRMLIVNGTVVQEGQEIAPGLTLERIGPTEALLNQRGLRFSIAY